MDTDTALQSVVLLMSAGGIALMSRGGWRLHAVHISFFVFLGSLCLAGLFGIT